MAACKLQLVSPARIFYRTIVCRSLSQLIINGKPTTPTNWKYKVPRNLIGSPLNRRGQPLPSVITLEILYEDNHVLIINKPPGLLCHHDITGDLTMVDYVKQYLITTYNKPGDAYVGLVHRLDRCTSGLVVIAKTSKASDRIAYAFHERNINKEYLCVVSGGFPAGATEGVLEHEIVRNDALFRTEVVTASTPTVLLEKKQLAKLSYRQICSWEVTQIRQHPQRYAMLAINLGTGRKHQIRAQMAHIGHPVVGDTRYHCPVEWSGGKDAIALHAYRLVFQHPTKDEIVT